MATSFRNVIQGAQYRSDQSVNGAGPHNSERTTDAEWRFLCNRAVNSLWRLASAARPDFQMTSVDFTLVSGGSAVFPLPSNFYDEIDVVFSPDQPGEYSLGSFAFQNRRAPGGWFPANFGGTTNYGGNSIRIMGDNLYVEPSLRAGGNYRLWFCPKPKLIRIDSTPIFNGTVRLTTAAALPANIASGSAGFGRQLTATANGALSIDGTAANIGDKVLVNLEANQINNGIFNVNDPGSAGTPWILQRASTTVTTGNLGFMVYTSDGATNVDVFFETTSLATVVDTTAWIWAEAFIEPIIEQFSELLELMTAIPAMLRDDDLDPKPLQLRAYGPNGMDGGLIGEMKAYFRQIRMGGTVTKMIDCDAKGPRSPWSL